MLFNHNNTQRYLVQFKSYRQNPTKNSKQITATENKRLLSERKHYTSDWNDFLPIQKRVLVMLIFLKCVPSARKINCKVTVGIFVSEGKISFKVRTQCRRAVGRLQELRYAFVLSRNLFLAARFVFAGSTGQGADVAVTSRDAPPIYISL